MEDILAPDSCSDSDHFSEDLFHDSESVVSFRPRSNAGVTDRVQDSPDPVRTTTGRPQPSRRLFTSFDERPLRNLTNVPRLRRSPTETDTQELILEELKRANSRLDAFSNHLQVLDCRMKSVEQMQLNSSTPSSSTDGSAHKSKRKVPSKVAMTVRDVYKALLEESDDFLGYDTKKRFVDKCNQDVVTRLVAEAGKLDSKVPILQLRDAARRFFQTTIEMTALRDKGKYDLKVTHQRRRNRLTRKFESRKGVFLKTSSLTDAQRDLTTKLVRTKRNNLGSKLCLELLAVGPLVQSLPDLLMTFSVLFRSELLAIARGVKCYDS